MPDSLTSRIPAETHSLKASEALGGISRITFQMSTASLETAAMKRSIELLGTGVAPIVRAAHETPQTSLIPQGAGEPKDRGNQ